MQPKMSQQAQASGIASLAKAKIWASNAKRVAVEAAKDRKIQVTVASAAGGTVAIGFCGAALGGVIGLPFALFTFGLSIPVTATIGAVAGGTAGCATGATVGFGVFTWRSEIEKFLSVAWSRINMAKADLIAKSKSTYSSIAKRLSEGTQLAMKKARCGGVAAKQKASELANSSVQLAKEPRAQVTAASAAVSGAALGAGGGAIGLATGGLAGAAVGILPAIFTFGLSIPVGAVVGGGTGLCLGSIVGGTSGVVGGGAVGYGVYGKKTEIYDCFNKCVAYVKAKKEQVCGTKCPPATQTKAAVQPKKTR